MSLVTIAHDASVTSEELIAAIAHTGMKARLWLAILADIGATLLVIANAPRLLRTPSP